MREINEESQEREKHLANLQSMIDEKHYNNKHNIQR